MKMRQNKVAENEYLLDLYEAKLEVAIARWQSGEYLSRETPPEEIEVEEH